MDTITKENKGGAELKIIAQPFLMQVAYKKSTTVAYYAFFKRLFDISVSVILIVSILSWLYPLLFLLINITSKGGTLFTQKRVGKDGNIFKCLKFRTMIINEDADYKAALYDDARITKIGKWLRLTYIDELPQLLNVLKGEMSIVGPRPHMLYHHRKFCKEVPFYDYRHEVKPGITGLSQMKGYHGSRYNHYIIHGRTRLDLFYVKKASFGFDMMIFIKTILIIFSFNKK